MFVGSREISTSYLFKKYFLKIRCLLKIIHRVNNSVELVRNVSVMAALNGTRNSGSSGQEPDVYSARRAVETCSFQVHWCIH